VNPRVVLAVALSTVLSTSVAAPAFAIGAGEIAKTDIRKLVDVGSLKGAKGAKKVAVAGYRVIFTTQSKVVARAEDWLGGVGGGRSSGAKATMEVVLGNVTVETLQGIADQAYADFLADLAEGGFEVVPTEAVTGSVAFKKLKTAQSSPGHPYTKKSRDRKTQYVVVSPAPIPLWFTNWDGDISDQGMGQTNIKAIMELSKELDAVVLHPIMHVNFATLGGSGGKFARRAQVTAKAAIYTDPGYTLFYYTNPKGGSFARIHDGIGVEGDPGEFVTADQASNGAFIESMQDIGIDFGPVKSKKNMVLQTNPENFRSMATEVLMGANEAFRRGLQAVQ
jgi:hypothetical protein